jgi:hypothetical protein
MECDCYCSYCGKDQAESDMEKLCPTCGADTKEYAPVYYECQHGVRYTDADADCDWTGKDRECTCG